MVESDEQTNQRLHQRFDIERTLRAVANGELRMGRVKNVSAGGAAIHLDQHLEKGAKVTLDIEDLGSFSGYVAGPPREGLVPIKFDIDEKEEERLIAEIMKIYNDMTWDD